MCAVTGYYAHTRLLLGSCRDDDNISLSCVPVGSGAYLDVCIAAARGVVEVADLGFQEVLFQIDEDDFAADGLEYKCVG